MKRNLKRNSSVLAISLAGVLVTVSLAFASIPDSGGVIHACYNTSANPSGSLRVIDTDKGATCAKNEKTLTFNQTGPQGPQGIQGPQGVQGPAGTNGIDGTNGTNGTDGATGPAGPSGPAGTNGVSGYEIVSHSFGDGNAGGTVYCPTGKHVLGGGAQKYGGASAYGFIDASNPVGLIGWFASVSSQGDPRVDTNSGVFIVEPGVTVWAICATTS